MIALYIVNGDIDMSKVEPFKRSLLIFVRKNYAEAPILNAKGKQERENVLDPNGNPVTYVNNQGKTVNKKKVKKKKFKDVDYIFRVYTNLVGLDEYLTIKYEDSIKSKKEIKLDLVTMLDRGVSFLTRRLKRKGLPKEFFTLTRKVRTEILKLEELILSYDYEDGKFIGRTLRTVKSSYKNTYKVKIIERLTEIIETVFEVMNVTVSTKKKSNPNLGIPYFQFDLVKSLSKQIKKLGQDEIRKYEITKAMLKAQDDELEADLNKKGLEVVTTKIYHGNQQALVKVAYKAGFDKLKEVKQPKLVIPENASEDEIELLTVLYEGSKLEYESYLKKKNKMIEGVYSSSFLEYDENTGTREYKVFDNLDQAKEALKLKADKEDIRSNLFPDISIEDRENRTYSVYFPAGKGKSGGYHLKRYDESVFIEDEDRTVQVSDSDGNTKGIRRIVTVKKAFIEGTDEPKDVITSGKYKGFLLEDIININGRLLEGSYSVKINGKTYERDLIEDGELKFAVKDLEGQISTRLLEPYITLSEDGERLCIGIPSGNINKLDRDAMLKLSQSIATIEAKTQFPLSERLLNTPVSELTKEEKKIRRQHLKANSLNPFYYFRAEDYEIVRDTLGSVALSKRASDYLDSYFDKLTKRERSLNEENLKNYTALAVGGFVSEFKGKPFNLNNKQVEAMAWLDANDFSGVMALDTGVGKTLLSVGAIRKAMATETGEKRRFLFVSPSRLNGNIEKEILLFIKEKDKKETLSRLDEMDYQKFTKLFEEKGTAYFKKEYYACFFDEVNEILSKTKFFNSLSGLKHPRKILLTASSIEKDPVDLYKFVSVSQGVEYDKKGENAWAKRYACEVGGRRIGINPDPLIQQEFYKWVKANAYFAFKEDVNFKDIGQPVLCKPETKSISLKMNSAVAKEYRKLARELTKELDGMLKKYRDQVEDPSAFEYTEEVVRRGKKKEVIKTLKDYAKTTLPSTFKKLLTLTTDPEQILGEKAGKNPKLRESSRILKADPNDRVVFFCSNNKMAKKACENNAKTRPSTIHGLLTPTSVTFIQASNKTKTGFKTLAKITKKTDFESAKWLKKQEKIMRLGSEEEDASWAIKASQKFIKENEYVSTIVCTDAYAKGFNFQTFQKVVHLDRGKGFDSELLKQRTARVYRTGQKGVVDEIYLDSSLTGEDTIQDLEVGEVSVQEMQRLLNCRDQKFFMDIISKGMAQSLTESLDKVESTTGLEIAKGKDPNMDQTYLAHLLDPSDEAIAQFEQKKIKEDENPLLYKAELPTDRYSEFEVKLKDLPDFYAVPNPKLFPRMKNVSLAFDGIIRNSIIDLESLKRGPKDFFTKLLDMAGAMNTPKKDPNVNLIFLIEYLGNDEWIVSNIGNHDKVTMERTIDLETNKISNEELRFKGECNPKQLGAKTVFTQVLSANRNGMNKIEMTAYTGTDLKYVGTRVWPKFGYGGYLRTDFLRYLPISKDYISYEVFRYLAKVNEDLDRVLNTMYIANVYIEDLFSYEYGNYTDEQEDALDIAKRDIKQIDFHTNEILSAVDDSGKNIGVDFWANSEWSIGAIDMKFDLSENSTSMRVLSEYFKKKCIERDIEPTEYLQEPLPPFDIYDTECWSNFVNYQSKKDVLEVAKKYPKEFKIWYYSEAQDFQKEDLKGLDLPVRTASLKKASMDEDIDDSILKSVWGSIGREMMSKSRNSDLLREKHPEKLMELNKEEN